MKICGLLATVLFYAVHLYASVHAAVDRKSMGILAKLLIRCE